MVASDKVQALLGAYEQQIKNIDDPDELGIEVILVLTTRDAFLGFMPLTSEQQQRLDRLDDELIGRQTVLAEVLPLPMSKNHDRNHWWWFLDEGPQVREEALQSQ